MAFESEILGLDFENFKGYKRGTVLEDLNVASSDKDVANLVKSMRHDGIKHQMSFSHDKTKQGTLRNNWHKTWQYMRNLHWKERTGTHGFYGSLINSLKSQIESSVAMLTANNPKVDFSARLEGYPDMNPFAGKVAGILQQIYDEAFENLGLQKIHESVALEGNVIGIAYSLVGVDRYAGEPIVEYLDPRFTAIDPTASGIDDARWFIRYRFVPVDWAKSRYPHIADQIKAQTLNDIGYDNTRRVAMGNRAYEGPGDRVGSNTLSDDGYVLLTEAWIKDDISMVPIEDDPDRVLTEHAVIAEGINPSINIKEPNPENPRYHFDQHGQRANQLNELLNEGTLGPEDTQKLNDELQVLLEHMKNTLQHPRWDYPVARKYKKLRRVDLVGDLLARDDETEMRGNVLANTIPVSDFSCRPESGNHYGNGVARDGIFCQDIINKIVGFLMVALARQTLAPFKAGFNYKKVRTGNVNTPLDIIQVSNPQELAATGFVNPPQIPGFILPFLSFVIQMQQRVTGVVDSMQGINPSGVRGNTHLQALWSSASTRFMPIVHAFERYMKREAMLVMAVKAAFSDDFRIKQLREEVEKTGSPRGANLSDYNFKVEARVVADDQPNSESKAQAFLAIMQSGLLEQPSKLMPFMDYLEREFPGLSSKLALIEQQNGDKAQIAQLANALKQYEDYIGRLENRLQQKQMEIEEKEGAAKFYRDQAKEDSKEKN